jgi:Haem-binding domain
MKNSENLSAVASLFTVFIFLILNCALFAQEASKVSAPLPESINNIVSINCMPCHSDKGGIMSRSKLNFSEWTSYSIDKQKKKAETMYKELKKDAMPPKSARENNPDIIPTKEQIETIKAWSDSLNADGN